MTTLHRRLATAALAGAFGLGSLAAGLAPALADQHHGDYNRNAGWQNTGYRDHRDYNRDWHPAPVYRYPAPAYGYPSYPSYPTYPAYGYSAPANGYFSVGVPLGNGYVHVGGGF